MQELGHLLNPVIIQCMGPVLLIAGAMLSLAGTTCALIIAYDACRNRIWKGLLFVTCCYVYPLFYALVEFEHDNKWLVVSIAVLGSALGAGLVILGRSS